MIMVHGDDFLCAGSRAEVEWLRVEIKKHFETKEDIIGAGEDQAKDITVLNRKIRWTDSGIEIEGDERHVDAIVKGLGIEEAKVLTIPADKDESRGEEDEDDASDALEGFAGDAVSQHRSTMQLFGDGSTRYPVRHQEVLQGDVQPH